MSLPMGLPAPSGLEPDVGHHSEASRDSTSRSVSPAVATAVAAVSKTLGIDV
jgi:hypothetical protein